MLAALGRERMVSTRPGSLHWLRCSDDEPVARDCREVPVLRTTTPGGLPHFDHCDRLQTIGDDAWFSSDAATSTGLRLTLARLAKQSRRMRCRALRDPPGSP